MTSRKASRSSLWLADNPGKRWTEVLFLVYSPFWILWALCILVPLQLYEVRHISCKAVKQGSHPQRNVLPAVLRGLGVHAHRHLSRSTMRHSALDLPDRSEHEAVAVLCTHAGTPASQRLFVG